MKMESKFWTSTTGIILRWVIFLPAAFAAALAAGAIAYLFNLIQSYFTGDSPQWAYLAAAVIAPLALLYVAGYIVPKFKKVVLYSLFCVRVILAIISLLNFELSQLNLGMLILQELMVLGSSLYLIRKMLTDEEF